MTSDKDQRIRQLESQVRADRIEYGQLLAAGDITGSQRESNARGLLELWRDRLDNGMTPFYEAYLAAAEAGATPADAQRAGAYAMLERFVEELEMPLNG